MNTSYGVMQDSRMSSVNFADLEIEKLRDEIKELQSKNKKLAEDSEIEKSKSEALALKINELESDIKNPEDLNKLIGVSAGLVAKNIVDMTLVGSLSHRNSIMFLMLMRERYQSIDLIRGNSEIQKEVNAIEENIR